MQIVLLWFVLTVPKVTKHHKTYFQMDSVAVPLRRWNALIAFSCTLWFHVCLISKYVSTFGSSCTYNFLIDLSAPREVAHCFDMPSVVEPFLTSHRFCGWLLRLFLWHFTIYFLSFNFHWLCTILILYRFSNCIFMVLAHLCYCGKRSDKYL